MGKRVWNLLGVYGAEPGELVGAKSGPIPQQRGVGGGLPMSVFSPDVQAKLEATGSVGPAGPAGPPGPSGSDATIDGVAAGGDLAGTYPDPELGPGTVGAAELATPIVGNYDGQIEIIADSTGTKLPFSAPTGANQFETVPMFDPAVPTDLIVPRDGLYRVGATARFPANSVGGWREAQIRIDRTAGVSRRRIGAANAALPVDSLNQETVVSGSVIVSLEVGDTLSLEVMQDNASDVGVGANVNDFNLNYLGPV